jgi:hypothetical protein
MFLLNCEYCKKRYDSDPIFLPCGWTACESHLLGDEFTSCKFCFKHHKYDNSTQNSYSINRQVLVLVLNQEKQMYYIKKLEKTIVDSKLAKKSPDMYVYDRLTDLINDLQLRKEQTIESIKLYYEKEIDKYEKMRQEHVKTISQNEALLQEIQNVDVDSFEIELKTLDSPKHENLSGILIFFLLKFRNFLRIHLF